MTDNRQIHTVQLHDRTVRGYMRGETISDGFYFYVRAEDGSIFEITVTETSPTHTVIGDFDRAYPNTPKWDQMDADMKRLQRHG